MGSRESSNTVRRTVTGYRAKNYKKFKHKNETSKSSRDLNLFGVDGTKEVSVKMTTIKSSSELADSTNSTHSKTQIQQIEPTTTTSPEWLLDMENNQSTETTAGLAFAYDDNYYQETLASEFRDDGSLVGGAWSGPSYNFSGLQVEPAGHQMLSIYSFCLLVDNQFE